MKKDKYLIIGLGNPGNKYVNTRHNIGFQMVDVIASYYNINIKKVKCKAVIGEGNIDGVSVIIAKPQTFMNLSGESVFELQNYFDIPTENIIVFFDDISLDVGKIRIRKKGSAGGHNGIKNIIYMLKSEDFPRVKVGIGAPNIPLVDYVLQNFSKEDVKTLTEIAKDMPSLISMILNDGIDKAMNKFN